MKYLLILLSILIFAACSRHKTVFLEEDPISDQSAYFSAQIDDLKQAYKIDELKSTKEIDKYKRDSVDAYVKVYLNSEGFPIKIENYRRHEFNNHVFYPYLIYVLKDEGGDYAVDIFKKTWEQGKLITKKSVASLEKREGKFKDLMRISLEDPNNKEILSYFYKFKFVTQDSPANKKVLEAVGFGDARFTELEGYNVEYPDVQLKLRFFYDKRADATAFQLSQPVEVRAKLIEFKDNLFLFEYVGRAVAAQSDGEVKALQIEGSSDKMYGGRDN